MFRRRNIFMELLFLCLFKLFLCTRAEADGQTGFCGTRTPVVNMCTNSEAVATPTVFIDTVDVPKKQNNTCICTVSPVSSSVLFLLSYRMAPNRNENFKIKFKFNDIVLNKTSLKANTTLSNRTELVLQTTDEFNKEGVCLILDTADVTLFNISCETSTSGMTKSSENSARLSTTASTVNIDGNTHSESDKDDDVIIIGSVIGVAVFFAIVTITVVIICCKRKKHKNVMKPSQTNNETTQRDDDDDCYMTENPMYNLTDIPQYSQINRNDTHLTGTNECDDRLLSNEYEIIPDSSNDVQSPFTQRTEQNEENDLPIS